MSPNREKISSGRYELWQSAVIKSDFQEMFFNYLCDGSKWAAQRLAQPSHRLDVRGIVAESARLTTVRTGVE